MIAVDAAGSGAFTTIQGAVDAAHDGDVLLVTPGTYGRFEVLDKSLTIVGLPSGLTVVQGGVRVADLTGARIVRIVNLTTVGAAGGGPGLASGLELSDNAGLVRVESCYLSGAPTGSGVRARSCADVALVACTVRGGTCFTYWNQVGWGTSDGLAVSESTDLTAYGRDIQGGEGAPSFCNVPQGFNGGDGGDIRRATVFTANTSLRGGRGGTIQPGSAFSCPSTGSGGDGLLAVGAQVRLLDCETLAGPPGSYVSPGCGDCVDFGYFGEDQWGAATQLSGHGRRITAQPLVPAGGRASIALRGEPGDRILLLISAQAGHAEFVPTWNGVLLVPRPGDSSPTRSVWIGTIPGSGVLEIDLPVPTAAPGSPARPLHVQAAFRDVQGQVLLSGARTLVVLP